MTKQLKEAKVSLRWFRDADNLKESEEGIRSVEINDDQKVESNDSD